MSVNDASKIVFEYLKDEAYPKFKKQLCSTNLGQLISVKGLALITLFKFFVRHLLFVSTLMIKPILSSKNSYVVPIQINLIYKKTCDNYFDCVFCKTTVICEYFKDKTYPKFKKQLCSTNLGLTQIYKKTCDNYFDRIFCKIHLSFS